MKIPKQIDDFEMLGFTTDEQLQEFAMDRGFQFNFIGFSDELLHKKVPLGHNLINLGGRETNGEGSHWVYWYNDLKGRFSLYFDSMGVGPEDEIFDLSYKPLYINHKQIQRYDEDHCGIYVINAATYVHNARDKKRSIKDFVKGYKDVSRVEYNDIHL